MSPSKSQNDSLLYDSCLSRFINDRLHRVFFRNLLIFIIGIFFGFVNGILDSEVLSSNKHVSLDFEYMIAYTKLRYVKTISKCGPTRYLQLVPNGI